MKRFRPRLKIALASCLLIASLAACDRPTEPEDHAVGVLFLDLGGREVGRVIPPRAANGALEVGLGKSAEFIVRVLDGDGQIHPVDGIEYEIRSPAVLIPSAADVSLEGTDRLRFTAKTLTNTTVRFDLFHAGHHEFQVGGMMLIVR